MKSMSHPLAELGEVVASGVTDAWAATSVLAQELAATAANAVEVVHPKPAKRRLSPWLLVTAGLVAALSAGWWMRRQRDTTADVTTAYTAPAAAPSATPQAASA